MTIYQTAVDRMYSAIKDRNKDVADAMKLIVAEFQRHSSKDLPDPAAISILKKLEADEVYMLTAKKAEVTSSFLTCVQSLIPTYASENDIAEFLKTVDFSKLKNKMQAIGMVKSNFNGAVDSDLVKRMVEGWNP